MAHPGQSARTRYVPADPTKRTFSLPGSGIPMDPPRPDSANGQEPEVESIPVATPIEYPPEIAPNPRHHQFKQEIIKLYPKAVDVYRAILDDPNAPVRMKAAVSRDIIEHAIGKPVQPTAIMGGILGRRTIDEFSDEELQHMMTVMSTIAGQATGPDVLKQETDKKPDEEN